ncbi:MAG: dnaJ 2 [Mucilaginibacter sp.]|nr:dnaJ 2 [Mucilaginibacter sp.]
MKDFYYILGTEIDCTPDEIREAYRSLSQKFRPDLNENSAYFQKRFREITEAYETLSDPPSRSRYNASLERAKPRPPGYSKTKRTDIVFTCMLILVTLGFSYYVYRSVRGSKTTKYTPTVATAPIPIIKHHKKKHTVKADADSSGVSDFSMEPPKVITDSVKNHPTPPPVAVNDNIADHVVNSSYDTYIHANATGVVYMRRLDDYTSAVVKVIPTNSKVTVLEKGQRYYKVSFDNETGYVPKWTIRSK